MVVPCFHHTVSPTFTFVYCSFESPISADLRSGRLCLLKYLCNWFIFHLLFSVYIHKSLMVVYLLLLQNCNDTEWMLKNKSK